METHNSKTAIQEKKDRLLQTMFEANNDTINELCDKAGISVKSFYKYTKEPEFQQAVTDMSERACTAHIPKILTALFRTANKGNIQAIRTALEIKGLIGSGGQPVNVAILNAPTHESKDYASPAEAIADIDRNIAELQAYKATLVQQQGNALVTEAEVMKAHEQAYDDAYASEPHAIHPRTEDDHHEQV